MSDIIQRLRCKYPMGPIGDNGEPEFGWRDFRGPAPEGMVLPTPLMLEAANALDAQTAEIAAQAQHANFLNAEITRLRAALTRAETWISETDHGDECRGGIFCSCGKYDAEKKARAALSGESKC